MLNLSTKDNALNLFQQGLSRREISKKLGVSHTAVNKWIKSSNNSHKSGNLETQVETPEKSNPAQSPLVEESIPYLDNNTSYVSTPSQTVQKAPSQAPDGVDMATGEISSSHDPCAKWRLQATVKNILGYKHRVNFCHRYLSYGSETVKVYGSEEHKPYYGGLMTCGLIWNCSICAPKIQAVRALEVRQAIDAFTASGGTVLMVTQTIPHDKNDDLAILLPMFSKAFQTFKMGRPWLALKDKYSIAGYIKALEVTWNEWRGWHPHLHTIFFLDDPAPHIGNFNCDLFDRWSKVTANAGFGKLARVAFDVQDASQIKEYLNKQGQVYTWSAEQELTRLHSKKSGRGFSPFGLARAYGDTQEAIYAELFREYERCFKGKRHMVWSRGWKKKILGTEGKTDEELAASVGEDDPLLARIVKEDWDLLYLQPAGWQGDLLQVVGNHGEEGLKHYLDAVLGKKV